MKKLYYTYQMIHKLGQSIAGQIKESGFNPDVIVAIGSGGFIPARILRTYLGKPILAVGIAYYDLNDKPMDYPRKVQWIEEAENRRFLWERRSATSGSCTPGTPWISMPRTGMRPWRMVLRYEAECGREDAELRAASRHARQAKGG